MKASKPSRSGSALPVVPQPKPIPFPPAAIWKNKEPGVTFEFRGNFFARHGMHVTRVVPNEPVSAGSDSPEPSAK